MKQLILILVIMISRTLCFGQGGEFKIHSSSLMYSDSTMSQLEHIVDSLNLKFRVCELNKAYYSKYQAKAHFIELEKGKIEEARRDMANDMSFNDFIKKYPKSTVDKNLLVVKNNYKSYNDKDIVEFSSIPEGHTIEIEGKPEVYNQLLEGTWVFDYWEGSDYLDESIRGFYFTTEFEKQTIPEAYARMIQYSDCMVDTSAQIFNENAERGWGSFDTKEPSKVTLFINYINDETNKPEYDEDNYENYWQELHAWGSLKFSLIDSIVSKQEKFLTLLNDAITEALEEGGSNDEFEEYVGRYYSKESALELKRGRIVVGGCSMDDGPRRHAMSIAVLSAETINWEIFLRAHLDIMNDRFERVSDGSYAQAGRQTYIQELEELDINVSDLLFGISLRIENPSTNHYYGSIGRLGRALSETKHPAEIETKMLEMIEDQQLDDYNRMLIYYLFLNYNHHIEDKNKKIQSLDKLKKSVMTLPDYLAKRIEIEE